MDMVVPLGYVKDRDWTNAEMVVSQVRGCMSSEAILKVILEVAPLGQGKFCRHCKVWLMLAQIL
jgi:deoxyribose-phosphate aldolase